MACFVVNKWNGVVHGVDIGKLAGAAPTSWATACGWRFRAEDVWLMTGPVGNAGCQRRACCMMWMVTKDEEQEQKVSSGGGSTSSGESERELEMSPQVGLAVRGCSSGSKVRAATRAVGAGGAHLG